MGLDWSVGGDDGVGGEGGGVGGDGGGRCPSYWRIPVSDSPEENLKKHFGEVSEWITSSLSLPSSPSSLPTSSPSLSSPLLQNKVFIHCQLGKSRSATIILAYGMRGLGHSLISALNIVNERFFLLFFFIYLFFFSLEN